MPTRPRPDCTTRSAGTSPSERRPRTGPARQQESAGAGLYKNLAGRLRLIPASPLLSALTTLVKWPPPS
jgi:hypothetical protein